MKTLLCATVMTLAMTLPAWAEHGTPGCPGDERLAPAAPSDRQPDSAKSAADRDLDVKLELGRGGFKLGSRLFGGAGVAGAWLNGKVGSEGLALDGRLQREDGRAWTFKFDVEMTDWLTRQAWRWVAPKVLTPSE